MRYFLWLSGFAVACSDVKSSEINTQGIYLNYSVLTEGEGLGSTANVMLNVGGAFGSYVELEGGDQLIVTTGEEANAETSILDMSSLFMIHSYGATFSTDTAGSAFELNFDRESLTDAPSSIAVLPEPFSLTAPINDVVISRTEQIDEELLITWDVTSNEPIDISIDGDCFSAYSETESIDAGSHSVPVSYFSDYELDSTSSCTATITVERKMSGTIDSAFDGGVVAGIQARTVNIRIEP